MLEAIARRRGLVAVWALVATMAIPATASAQDFADSSASADDDDSPTGASTAAEGTLAPATRYGIGLRGRFIFLPEGMLHLFFEDVPSGVGSAGFGLELVRRKGDFDIVVGLEYEGIAPDEGFFRDDPDEAPDLVTFDGFAMLGLDVAFVWHKELAPKIALRYGAGLGLGAVLGDIYQRDTTCTNLSDVTSCRAAPQSAPEKNDDVPPVVPIVNLLVGARFELAPQLTLNLETGFRNLFYAGVGTTYLF